MNSDYSTVPTEAAHTQILEATIPLSLAGQRLDRVLAQLFPEYSRSRLSQWIDIGAVTLDGQAMTPKHAKKAVGGGEHIVVHTQPLPETSAFQPEMLSLNIVHEDETLIVINKPAGLIVHPGHGNWSGTLLNGLLHHCSALHAIPRAGIVHRLDKDTSGLLVIAKTLTAQTELIRQLQARTVKREYQALVWGLPARPGSEQRIETWMGRHPKQRTRMSVLPEGFGKRALTFYRVHRYGEHYSWVHCRLATGRTHQIRVHMAHLGHPILGDTVYGRRHDDFHTRFEQHALHAFRLALEHPLSRTTLSWKAPLPETLHNFIEEQGWHEPLAHETQWDEEDWSNDIDWDEDDDGLDEE